MKHTNLFIQTARSLSLLLTLLLLSNGEGLRAQAPQYVTGDQYKYNYTEFFLTGATIKSSSPRLTNYNNIFNGNKDDGFQFPAAPNGTITITINLPANQKNISKLILKQGNTYTYEKAKAIKVKYNGTEKNFNDLPDNEQTIILDLKMEIPGNSEIELTITTRSNTDQYFLHEIYASEKTEKETSYETNTILHKAAKWHGLRNGNNITDAQKKLDTFSDGVEMFDPNKSNGEKDGTPIPGIKNYGSIQATHTLVDTIYMQKGRSADLVLPNYLSNANTMNGYVRWYNFRTGQTFRTNNTQTSDVFDLLTPKQGQVTPYRFANGYVTRPLIGSGNNFNTMNFYFPTDDQFYQWFTSDLTNDNKWYAVACDVSQYTDYGTSGIFGEGNNYYEPTLTHRIIYYIKVLDPENPPYEEYEINMPATRVRSRTNEFVILSKIPSSYGNSLTATISWDGIDNDKQAKIQFVDPSSTSTTDKYSTANDGQKIFFYYPNTNTDNTRTVLESSDETETRSAIIIVKNNNDKPVAKFKLNFPVGNRLLTQSMANELDTKTADQLKAIYQDAQWTKLGYRTPKAIHEDPNNIVLTELTMDYDATIEQNVENHNNGYYPFPLAWSSISYGFYDGSTTENQYDGRNMAEWGNYAITTKYMECTDGGWNGVIASKPPIYGNYNPQSYHLFIDASNRPGRILRTPFRENLCPGAKLTVSAWVKSALWGNTSDNAGMLFTIVGETEDGEFVPIYRFLTGQIPSTYVANCNLPGFETDNKKNEWFHVYFSFINENNKEYTKYYLQVDNNSASTNGGDMYLDDVRVYMQRPKANVKQKKITCDETTLMTLSLDWETLLSRIGKEELTGENSTEHTFDFCFVDSIDYENTLKKNPNDIPTAINASWVPIGQYENMQKYVVSLSFDLNFEKNGEYYIGTDTEKEKGNLILQGDGLEKDHLRRTGEEKNRSLIGDFYSALKQNRRYMILIRDNSTGNQTAEGFGDPRDVCSVSTSFSVESQNQVLLNGEILDAGKTQEYCTGQSIKLSMKLRVPKLDEGKPVLDENGNQILVDYEQADKIYYDWYFNSDNDFDQPQYGEYNQVKFGGVTLKEALKGLRANYPDATVQNPTPAEGEEFELETTVTATEDGSFTLNHIELINYKLNQKGRDDAVNRKLILHRKTLDVRLLDDEGRTLKICPIQQENPDGIFCAEPIDLRLTGGGKAPSVQPGFEYMEYPEETYNPAMRIGLKHIISSSKEHPITVNLRNIRFALKTTKDKEEGNFDKNSQFYPEGQEPNHVGLMKSPDGKSYNDIYLIGTTDPAYTDLFPTNDKYTYIIGKVKSFFAQPRYEGDDIPGTNLMEIYFTQNESMTEGNENLTFVPKEGYEYTFMVRYEEHQQDEHTPTTRADGDNDTLDGEADKFTACYGNFIMTMKVVPEYLVWQGTTTGLNWNDDSKWKRATNKDIHSTTNIIPKYDETTYTGNPGYVPMRFSKIIIPRDGKVELYKAGFEGDKTKYQAVKWKTEINDEFHTHMDPPAADVYRGHPIQYDMMVYGEKSDNGYINMHTDPYTVNRCEEVHFEPGAEMMHAELLSYVNSLSKDDDITYQKAWVEYELEKGRWYALSSPLQNVFSGDFYTGKDGKEASEYFNNITWKTDNSRLNPTVYQRGWNRSSATMVGVSDDTKERAIAGNWSALYNKVDEDYSTQGFSLRVQDINGTGNTALFRLPKADNSYTYNGNDGNTPTETISREANSHKLRIDNLNVDQEMTVPLAANDNNPYYLVGNPFMAQLNMKDFFDKNTSLAPTYWLVNKDNQQIVVNGSNDAWTANGKEGNDGTVPPLTSFFVKKADNETTNEVTFTADMQALSASTDAGTGNTETDPVLYLTATTADGRQSHASVAYKAASDKGYRTDEDAELFLDSNLGNMPMVYTVAGTMAASVNRTSDLYDIPVGVYGGDKGSHVTLSFDGLESFSSVSLYDAVRKSETPLHEGKKIEIPAATAGRYYLRAGTPTSTEVIAHNAFRIYTVGREQVVVTSANAPLKRILVYTMDGTQVRNIPMNAMQWQFHLPTGLYLVTAIDSDGLQETTKLIVK